MNASDEDAASRFAQRVARDGQCLIWIGAKDRAGGYGMLNVRGRHTKAHRFAWERVNGPIPDGMVIDHICHNRGCVEVSHLRLATASQNGAYRCGAQKNSALGVRNVRRDGTKFRVQVRKAGVSYGGAHDTLDAAIAEASSLREALFGNFAGYGEA